MAKLSFAPVERKKLEVNGEIYEVLVTEVEIAEMVGEFETAMQRAGKKWMNKKLEAKPGEIKEACEFLKMPAMAIDRMLGEGALGKIMGAASVPFNKTVEIFETVSTAIIGIYEADLKKLYE